MNGHFARKSNNRIFQSKQMPVELVDLTISGGLAYCFLPGYRKDSQLLYTSDDGQFFTRSKTYKNKTVYVCYEKTCRSRVFWFHDGKCTRNNVWRAHNHGDKRQMFDDLNARKSLLETATRTIAGSDLLPLDTVYRTTSEKYITISCLTLVLFNELTYGCFSIFFFTVIRKLRKTGSNDMLELYNVVELKSYQKHQKRFLVSVNASKKRIS